MDEFKIAIIGAGSSYTPEIIERLAALRDVLPVTRLLLMDIDPERLAVMTEFCRRYLHHLGHHFPIDATTDRTEAIDGACYVITQVRVGGNRQRVLDEKMPLKWGVIGQETTGPGGMFKALRTIPVMLEIARDVERINPGAWIINYANPTGLNAEAVLKYTRAKFVGLCSGGFFPRDAVAGALGVPAEAVEYNYFGLNHLNFAHQISVGGRPLTDEEFDRVAERIYGGAAVSPALIKTLRLLPSPYLQYFFHRRKRVEDAQRKEHTRGEIVQALEGEVFAAYADPLQVEKPAALARRGGGGYSEIAVGVIDAIHNNRGRSLIVNTANRGAVAFLPDDAVLELPALVSAAGIRPLAQPEIPRAVWGLIAAVKNYEQLVVEAAVTGSRERALEALLAHPLVGDWETAVGIFDEMLAANRSYLPQFDSGAPGSNDSR
jgi:6-phospho-beta-glucosidase